MESSILCSKLMDAPKDAPVFSSQKLEPDFILKTYRFGPFPWTNKPVTWWYPGSRCVLNPSEIHIQKDMKKFINLYQIKLDYDFLSLIHLCRNTRPQSWIDDELIENYYELFKQGYVHTLELYKDKELIGGIYGLIIGKVFSGESMVSPRKNAPKIALVKLCKLLKPYDFVIDCQAYNKHLEFMGAKDIERKMFLNVLEEKCDQESGFTNFSTLINQI